MAKIRSGEVGFALLLVALALAPVPAAGQGIAGAQVRDSAGVRIVEYAAIPERLPEWRLHDEPRVRIGAVHGAGPEIFGRVSHLVWRADSVIVAVEAQVLQIRAFAPSGEHLWTAGGSGGGPGEFNRLNGLWLMPGDSLLAADGPRLSVFDRTGRYVRGSVLESPAPDALATPSVAGVLASGGLTATLAVRTSSSDDGYFRPWFAHALLDPFDGRLLETLGTFPGAEIARRSGGGVEVSGELVITTGYASTPVSRRTVVTTAGDRVVIGEQGRFELFQFDANGALRMIVRIAEPPRPLDSARYHAFSDGACPAVGCWWNVALPETLPMFGKLLLDHDGELWVEEFVPEYEDRLPRWWVLGRSGEFVARVELPPRFTPHGLGGGEVLGVMLDELDVNYVERRAIRR